MVYPGCVTVRGGKATDLVRFGLPNQEVIVTLDDVANDGPPGADINIRSDVEDLFGGTGGDTLVGSKGANVLDGGFGPTPCWVAAGTTFSSVAAASTSSTAAVEPTSATWEKAEPK